MYTNYNYRQIERQFDREEEKVGTDRCIQHITKDREIVNRQEEEEVGTDRCIQHITIDRESL